MKKIYKLVLLLIIFFFLTTYTPNQLSKIPKKENNFFYGIQGNYLFGNNVKDTTIFDNITTSTGAIIGAEGQYANINLMERGFDAHLFIGYALHFNEQNLSGFYFSSGLGFLQHQIFIDTKNQNVLVFSCVFSVFCSFSWLFRTFSPKCFFHIY